MDLTKRGLFHSRFQKWNAWSWEFTRAVNDFKPRQTDNYYKDLIVKPSSEEMTSEEPFDRKSV